ncbi:O-antigen ligase family protein [Flavobacterium sp.]|uniref:O-antigen ligase family protein n=1 Tax=Flavobacterium sp. TaxID=239 RepID=UPI004048B9BB
MKVKSKEFYSALFIIIILLQLYLPSFKANLLFQIIALGIFFLLEKVIINKNFLKTILPILLIFLIGFTGFFVNKFSFFNAIKDVFHFLKPITGLLIGYCFYKKIDDFRFFIKTIINLGLISSLIHFLILIFISGFSSVNEIREFGRDNFLELFSLFFLIFYRKFQNERIFKSQFKYYVFVVLLLISNVLYFSRTMIVSAIILLITIYGYTIITKKGIKIIGIVLFAIVLFYGYLFSIKISRNQPGLESFLYKIKNAPSEILKTKIDRENHKDLWDHWRGYEAKRAFYLMQEDPKSFIIGTGYGSLVNLKFFAPLTENNKDKGIKFISELHNGYVYILYKTGIVGLFLYLYFLIKIYKHIYINRNIKTYFISGIGLVFVFTTLTITGIYNSRDIIVFVLGALLFYERKINKV